MTVSEVMTANVHSVAPEISTDDARAMMRRHRVHHLVVKKASNWVGIVSAHDLARRSPARRTRPVKVGDVMTRHVMTLDEQASVDRASHMMRGHSIGCLLVLAVVRSSASSPHPICFTRLIEARIVVGGPIRTQPFITVWRTVHDRAPTGSGRRA